MCVDNGEENKQISAIFAELEIQPPWNSAVLQTDFKTMVATWAWKIET